MAAASFAVLLGQIADRTTGQPLADVRVSAGAQHAVTHPDGSFKLGGLKAGSLTLTVESADVPPQHFTVTLGSATTHAALRVCSTTLDYNCGAPQ